MRPNERWDREQKLYDELHDVFDQEFVPSPVHTFLAGLPEILSSVNVPKSHQLVVTTNYDDLMEKAFDAGVPGEPYDLVYYDARAQSPSRGKFLHRPFRGTPNPVTDPNKLNLPLAERSVVLKIHGAVAHHLDSTEDSYVITEDHYFDYPFYDEIPISIREEFQRRRFLFLGYSLGDWNLRLIFRRIWKDQLLGKTAWTVNFKDDPVQRLFWEKRNVRYVVATLEDYTHDLGLKLAELK